MTLMRQTSSWTISVTGVTYTFQVLSGRMKLDERNSIYGVGQVECAPVPAAIFAQLTTTGASLRASLVTARTVTAGTESNQSRTFDLAIVEAREDPTTKRLTLELRTDEALLEVRGRVAATAKDDYASAYVFTPTIRQMVGAVLTDYLGATLTSAGAADVDGNGSRLHARQNMLPTGSFEANIGGWTASNATLSRQNNNALFGSWTLRAAATAAGNVRIRSPKVSIQQLAVLHGMGNVKPATTGRTCYATITFYDAAGTSLGLIDGAQIAVAAATYGYLDVGSLAGALYAQATSADLSFVILTAASGQLIYLDGVFFETVPDDLVLWNADGTPQAQQRIYAGIFDYDDPSLAVWSTEYNYGWDGDGTAHANPSHITPKSGRPSLEMHLHRPGQMAADFLRPWVLATGGRLFCDETRAWRLVSSAYTPAGTITLDEARVIQSAGKLNTLAEAIDGVPTNFSGVVIEYHVPDEVPGWTTTRIDYAGTGTGRTYHQIIEGGYPGSGAAAALLARAAGRIQGVPIGALSDYLASPGKALSMTINATARTGYIGSVEWTYSNSSESDTMTIVPRDVV